MLRMWLPWRSLGKSAKATEAEGPLRGPLPFTTEHYQRINHRRLEHLASLHLPLEGSTVLEVGAGIGDLTTFFLDRGCRVTTSDGRPENVQILQSRYPDLEVIFLDLDAPDSLSDRHFDIVFCYGVLYHLRRPAQALEYLAERCQRFLLLETCVTWGEEQEIHPCEENRMDPTQSISGQGCRPTRRWVFTQMRRHFPYVYLPRTQPYHEQFPTDWRLPPSDPKALIRAVFIGSREPLTNDLLVDELPLLQPRRTARCWAA
ncbi:MAG: class I SAM-dependent methyltransferase [Gemmataceae bacterium]|nr:class I SAM-dependent methyltransferase [Gemmataceae bacterium]